LKVNLKHAVFEVRDGAAWTRFEDGAECANWIPKDGGHFATIAREVGFNDPQTYLVQHELLHSLVPEVLFDRPGYVVWMMAHGKKANLAASMAEERLIHYIALAACGRCPIIDPQWGEIISRLNDLSLSGNPMVASALSFAA
jgi:hypothetical protein